MVALKGDPEIGDKINKIIGCLADANDSLKGAIDVADFADEALLGKGKEMVDTLSHLVAIFQEPELDFTRNSADGDDLLGDAYEYLMRNFATESGKSKGQFYTPAEVSRVIAQVIGLGSASSPTQTIYDPTCGSGSLLLKAHDLRPGEGQRHERPGSHEHGPTRRHHRRDLARQHPLAAALARCVRRSQDLRLCCGQSSVFDQSLG
jgi:type I restriction enzyme M protein